MLSGTAGTSLRESRRPPVRALWPRSPHPAGSLRIRTTLKCASPAIRQRQAQPAKHLCPPATPAAAGKLARHATRPSLSHEPAPGEPVPGPGPAGEAVVTVIPRGSARAVGIPAGDAASIRAAIPAGPPSPQVSFDHARDRHGAVDGRWRPHSRNALTELPGLITALDSRPGVRVQRLSIHRDDCNEIPRRLGSSVCTAPGSTRQRRRWRLPKSPSGSTASIASRVCRSTAASRPRWPIPRPSAGRSPRIRHRVSSPKTAACRRRLIRLVNCPGPA
jgi:hypothetical protein